MCSKRVVLYYSIFPAQLLVQKNLTQTADIKTIEDISNMLTLQSAPEVQGRYFISKLSVVTLNVTSIRDFIYHLTANFFRQMFCPPQPLRPFHRKLLPS